MKFEKKALLVVMILLISGGGVYLLNSKQKNLPRQDRQNESEKQNATQTQKGTEKASRDSDAQGMVSQKADSQKQQCHQLVFQANEKRVHARELLSLPEGKINPRSVCVRVNGVAVKHQLRKEKANEVLIEGLPAQASQIVVQYCDQQLQCPMPCQVKKDEFLSALSGGEQNLESDPMELAQGWEGSAGDAELDAEEKTFKAEVKEFRKELTDSRAPATRDQFSSRWKVSENTTWCDSSLKAAR